MKLFRKILLAFSAISMLAASQGNSCENPQACQIQRVVTWQKVRNQALEGSFNPIDPLHAGMKALGGPFNQSFIDCMVATAISNFKEAYGIDFSDPAQASYDPTTGIYTLLNGSAIMIPYLNNPPCEDIYITSDTANPERACNWVQISFGQFVFFESAGTFATGSFPNSGAEFAPGNLWFYGYSTFIEKGASFNNPLKWELVPIMSYQLGQQFPNQWTAQTGLLDILVPMSILNTNGQIVGNVVFPTSFVNIPQGATNTTTYALNYGYYQWPGINCLPLNCLAPK